MKNLYAESFAPKEYECNDAGMLIECPYSDDQVPEDYWRRFGRFVKSRRVKLGKKQLDLSLDIGMAQANISRIENGIQPTSFDTIFKLSKALKVSMCDMIAAMEGVSDIDDLNKFLLYKSAPDVYRNMVNNALEATERENAQRIGPVTD